MPPYIPDLPDQPKTATSWAEIVLILAIMAVVLTGAIFGVLSM